jgi:hypothetical protein
MPQDKRRQPSADRPTKTPSRLVSKTGAVMPVKRKAAKSEPTAKPKVAKAVAELPVKRKAVAGASAKLTKANAKDAARPVKRQSKGSAANLEQPVDVLTAVQPAIDSNSQATAAPELIPAAEKPPIVEPAFEPLATADGFGPVGQDRSTDAAPKAAAIPETAGHEAADRGNESVKVPEVTVAAVGSATEDETAGAKIHQPARASIKPSVERRITTKSLSERRQTNPFAQERRRVNSIAPVLSVSDYPIGKIAPPATAIATPPAAPVAIASEKEAAVAIASAKEDQAAEPLTYPAVERRKTIRSLFERRLADPSAKERRASELLGNEAAVQRPKLGSSTKQRTDETAADVAKVGVKSKLANDTRETDRTSEPAAAPTSADPHSNLGRVPLESAFAASEQRNMYNQTAVWMRRAGAVLIGLNALILLVALFVWRSHSSQQAEIKAMQKANAAAMAEAKRATAASEGAEYVSCLGSQTAQSILMQIRSGSAHPSPIGSAARTTAARAQAAQIEFDAEKEKTIGLNVHMPVLFHLGIENIGKSSALNANVWGEVKVLDSNKQPNFKYDQAVLTKEAIAPTDSETNLVLYTTHAGLVEPLTEDEFRRVNSGSAYVVAYGKVEYDDVYGARHWAVFCHAVTEPVGTGTRFRKCQSYNNTGVTQSAEQPVSTPNGPQNIASLTLPAVACSISKQEKN